MELAKHPAFQTGQVELGCVGNGHHRHHPRLDRITHHQVCLLLMDAAAALAAGIRA